MVSLEPSLARGFTDTAPRSAQLLDRSYEVRVGLAIGAERLVASIPGREAWVRSLEPPRELGVIAGTVFGAAVVALLLFVFRRIHRILISRFAEKRRDWAFVVAGGAAIMAATGAA